MAQVKTNNVSLSYGIEPSLAGDPTKWFQLEPNGIGAFGASITAVSRRPISKSRGRRKGTVTDEDSSVEFDGDLTMSSFADFMEGFLFSKKTRPEFDFRLNSSDDPPTAGTNLYNILALTATNAANLYGDATAGNARSLIFAKGYSTAANNGLKRLTTQPADTDTTLTATGQNIVAEASPPANASLQIAGVTADDIALTVTSGTATLASTKIDWTTLGLKTGQYIHIGSSDESSGNEGKVTRAYTSNTVYGYARITAITAASLSLDKLDTKLSASASAADVDVMFGHFGRDVDVDSSSTDAEYLERTYQFEAAYPDLGGSGTDEYEYAKGNHANELALNLGLADKATVNFGFVGTKTDDITATRKSGASSAVEPLRTTAVNTSSDVASLTTDLISLASDVCFKSLTLTLVNNISPEKCIGTVGAVFVNTGLFEVNLEGQLLFTNKEIVNAIRNNTTVTFACILKNDDGAIAIDLPAMTIGDGSREYPVDQSVLVNLTGETFKDPTLGTSIGISTFPSVPTIRS